MKLRVCCLSAICISLLVSCNIFKDEPIGVGVDSLLYQMEEEPIIDTPIVVEEPELEPIPEPVIEKNYKMIVGSFQVEANAEKYAQKLADQGYQTEIIQASNGYFRVSAKAYPTLKEGLSELETFRYDISENAWVHVKK